MCTHALMLTLTVDDSKSHDIQGDELRKIFIDSGGSFSQLEIKVKQWVQKTKTEESVERPVTRTMLKEIYHWDELGAQCKLIQCNGRCCSKIHNRLCVRVFSWCTSQALQGDDLQRVQMGGREQDGVHLPDLQG